MPIYMDRHDVSDEVNAEYVAKLHQEDLKIEKQFGCRGLTYWFDGIRKMAFCLMEAPAKESVIELHEKAHGGIPSQIIEVDATIVEAFLGRIEDPENLTGAPINIIDDSPFRIIMAINFYLQTPEEMMNSIQNFRDEIAGTVSANNGTVVKQKRDGFIISFTSASKAVAAALKIRDLFQQKGFRSANNSKFKISLTAGVPVTDTQEFFQETIKTAERFCRVVSGDVIISSAVKELYYSENGNPVKQSKYLRYISPTDETFLNLLSNFIESHWHDTNLKVEDLTKPTTCSKSRLYRNLKKLTAKSPNELINNYRLEEAHRILNNSEKTVAEVAFETGFSSPSYFTKCFQKKYDYLPSRSKITIV